MAAQATTAPAHQTAPNPFPGNTLDCDGHVYIHPDVFREIFPELSFGYNFEFLDGYVKHPEFKERRESNREQLWETKGLGALGAYDPDERVEALDRMGIKAQLMFANNTLYDLRATTKAARDACVRYNDYALDFTRRTKGRCRAVCHINTSDVDFAIADQANQCRLSPEHGVPLQPLVARHRVVVNEPDHLEPFDRMAEQFTENERPSLPGSVNNQSKARTPSTGVFTDQAE